MLSNQYTAQKGEDKTKQAKHVVEYNDYIPPEVLTGVDGVDYCKICDKPKYIPQKKPSQNP